MQNFLPGQKVKSPTYTLVESYSFLNIKVHHFDLYRLCDAEELEYLAIRDLLTADFIALVEWPQKGSPNLPSADVLIAFEHQSIGRSVSVQALSVPGQVLAKALLTALSGSNLIGQS
nr:tRNA (adenosine(37)-N6)-threonylcarbamoyltransferase complex ATPase subunit type 1 TsaE [Thiomicrorhabdus aquaedulcis]